MNVGILGCGNIGSGVLNLIDNVKDKDVKVLKVFDLPVKKEMLKERFADTIEEVCANPMIDTVVEAMGGDEFPYKCIKMALLNKKNVVTSNKEVVSKHLEEFYSLAKENDVYFMCEASVGGGIPLICSLIDSVKINSVSRVYGIINGTTNYILTRMNNEGISLDEALAKAKELGFAEADATADLEGLDMLRKICILSSIAYGGYVPYTSIYHYGIIKVTKEILDGIKKQGYVLKFVAESRLDNGNVKIAVEPVLVTSKNPLSGVSYEFNAVYYQASTNDLLGFYGKGAGKFPTATAMVADIQRILSKSEKYYFENDNSFSVSNFTKDADYYVVENGVGKIVKGLDKCACEYDFVARIFD